MEQLLRIEIENINFHSILNVYLQTTTDLLFVNDPHCLRESLGENEWRVWTLFVLCNLLGLLLLFLWLLRVLVFAVGHVDDLLLVIVVVFFTDDHLQITISKRSNFFENCFIRIIHYLLDSFFALLCISKLSIIGISWHHSQTFWQLLFTRVFDQNIFIAKLNFFFLFYCNLY